MLKREVVWRYVADEVLAGRRTSFHQNALAVELGMSVGNVNLALEPLRAFGAVSVVGKDLVIRDVKKILLFWGARHQPGVILARFSSQESSRGLLKVLPPGLALTSFAGFVTKYREEPAPFSVVRAYARQGDAKTLEELRRRFTQVASADQADLIVHSADPMMARKLPNVVSPAQMYVDLWSEADFFASDYLRVLERKLQL